MPKILQFKRYSSTTVQTSLGVEGELFIDLGKKTIAVMDGVTLGGSPLATEAQVTSVSSTLTTNYKAADSSLSSLLTINYSNADTALNSSLSFAMTSLSSVITTNYTSSVSNLSSVLTTNYRAADSSISFNVSTLSSNVSTLSSNTWRAATISTPGLVRADGTSINVSGGVLSLGSSITASWTIQQSSNGSLYFYHAGVAKFRLGTDGVFSATSNIGAFVTI